VNEERGLQYVIPLGIYLYVCTPHTHTAIFSTQICFLEEKKANDLQDLLFRVLGTILMPKTWVIAIVCAKKENDSQLRYNHHYG
jgi:hypothetical protein